MIWMWSGLFALVLAIVIFDLSVVSRRGVHHSLRATTLWTIIWMGVGAGFSGVVYYLWSQGHVAQTELSGGEALTAYLTTWALELALSLDNIFVMTLIFARWRIPEQHEHTVLFYGIFGAAGLRTLMVIFGAQLVERFELILPAFGLYFIFLGGKALYAHFFQDVDEDDDTFRPKRFLGVRIVAPDDGGHFFLRNKKGKLAITTLFAALVTIEAADLLFAIDSVPSALGVTQETWIIAAATMLAMIGVRSMYSLLTVARARYDELNIALGLLLLLNGVKMIAMPWADLPNIVSLVTIGVLFLGALVFGVIRERRERT